MRVILAGGGTGGHVIPALAIAANCNRGTQRSAALLERLEGLKPGWCLPLDFPLELIQVGALNQVSFATRVKTVLGLPLAVVSSSRIVRKFRPDVMIGVGGYASGPAMVAAALSRVPPWP